MRPQVCNFIDQHCSGLTSHADVEMKTGTLSPCPRQPQRCVSVSTLPRQTAEGPLTSSLGLYPSCRQSCRHDLGPEDPHRLCPHPAHCSCPQPQGLQGTPVAFICLASISFETTSNFLWCLHPPPTMSPCGPQGQSPLPSSRVGYGPEILPPPPWPQ